MLRYVFIFITLLCFFTSCGDSTKKADQSSRQTDFSKEGVPKEWDGKTDWQQHWIIK